MVPSWRRHRGLKLDSPFSKTGSSSMQNRRKIHPFGWAGRKLLNINHRNRYKISIVLIVLLNKMWESVTQGPAGMPQHSFVGFSGVICNRSQILMSLI